MLSSKIFTCAGIAICVYLMTLFFRKKEDPSEIVDLFIDESHHFTKSGTPFSVVNGFVQLEAEPGYVVPNMVHFIFGLDPTFGHIGFGLVHYLAVLGAYMNIEPELIVWTHKYLPNDNPWFECARPLLFLNEAKVSIFYFSPSFIIL